MKKIITLIYLLIYATTTAYCNQNSGEVTVKRDKLIEREVLFGNPDKIMTRLSDDGRYISFIAPKDGVLNVWVAPTGDLTKAKVITDEKTRGIRRYFWSKNNTHIIYAQDKNGDENWRLYSVNIENLEQKDLTPLDGVRASVLKLSSNFPSEMLVLLNDRVAEYHDIYKVNLETGARTLVYENTGNYASFIADEEFSIRFAYKMLPSGEGEMYIFEAGDMSRSKLFQKIAVEDMLNTAPLHITRDGTFLYMIDSTGQDTSALVQVNLATHEKKIIHADPRADVADLLVNPVSKIVQAVSVEYLRKEWKVIDNAIAQEIDELQKIDTGDVEVISRTRSDDKWIVAFLKDDGPFAYYLYNRENKAAKFLFVSNSSQKDVPFAKMHPVKIKARDGLELVSYLTLPRWLDNGGVPSSPVPMVLYVHGGPNARDVWGFNATHQWLANRGYAVLSVNYRGSTGLGKSFTNAGDGQWARAMHDDLEDAVAWAIDNNIAQKEKVAIMGGSYGGYATLVGLTKTPDLFAAGIDTVGPSNLETLLKSIPPYWKPMVAHLNKIIGASVDTPEGLAFLRERSPLTYAEKIKKPLLIVQGANDPRVKQAESDQIVAAMVGHKIPVVYLLYPDEGHGLARPENRLSMYALSEVFLANFLGGESIPHDNKFPGSTIEVKEGSEITWTKKVEK